MNQKQLLILIVILALLGGAALVLLKQESATRQGAPAGSELELLADLPVGEQLSQIVIRNGTNTLTLSKQDGVWCVSERGNYPANYPELTRMVLKLRDLEPVQTEPVSPPQLARLELLEPGSDNGGGTLIEFRDPAGDLLGSLILGKEQTRKDPGPSQFGGSTPTEIPVGRWIRDPGATGVVAVVSDPLSDVEADPKRWLDKDFLKVQKIRSIEVTYPDQATHSFALTRGSESGPWSMNQVPSGREVDSSKTSGFNYALSGPSFADVVVDPDPAALGLDSPTRVVIDTFDGFHYVLRVGTRQDNNLPLQVTVKGNYPRERTVTEGEDESVKTRNDQEFARTLKSRDEKLEKEQALEPWTYWVPSWTMDSVLKKRDDLLKDRSQPEQSAAGADLPKDPVADLLDLPASGD